PDHDRLGGPHMDFSAAPLFQRKFDYILKIKCSTPSFVQPENIQPVGRAGPVKCPGTLDPWTMVEISRKVVPALELEISLK
ncbi:MAG: hypothetical protein JW883_13155, partial [Deltaproteobacteria bacterium]|nr:hypothetical protein [Deltaproteobacteria bacterium]